ncbi:hypothetical protein FOB73_04960 [Yersinia pseudotuberculosis]|nr:hypothetical protein FOB73_04960 [Yersinia pseudotuberculosis]
MLTGSTRVTSPVEHLGARLFRDDPMHFPYTFRLIITASDFIVNTASDWILFLTVIKLTHEKEAINARTVR